MEIDNMPIVFGDFNSRLEGDLVRMDTTGGRRTLEATGASTGDRVWVCDGEVRVRGVVERYQSFYAVRIDPSTFEEVNDPP